MSDFVTLLSVQHQLNSLITIFNIHNMLLGKVTFFQEIIERIGTLIWRQKAANYLLHFRVT